MGRARLSLRHPETAFRAVLVVVAAYMLLTARSYPTQARVFPQFASALVIGGVAALFVMEGLGLRPLPQAGEAAGEVETGAAPSRTLRRAMMWLVLFYLAATVALGLITGSGLFLLAALLRSRVPWQQAFGVTAAVVAFLYLFFAGFLHITLPEGVLLPLR